MEKSDDESQIRHIKGVVFSPDMLVAMCVP